MSNLSIPNTFSAFTSADASQVNADFASISTWLNNRDNGTDYWLNLKLSGTAANPAEIKSSAATCELDIDCTGSNGTPILSWRRSGTIYFTAGVDGAASNIFKLGTTGLTTNVALQVPSGGVQVQFANGSSTAPAVSFINDTAMGMWRFGSNQVAFTAGLAHLFYISTTEVFDITATSIYGVPDNTLSCGKSSNKWTAVWATNGTIQTSHSSQKHDIRDIGESFSIPHGSYFARNGSDDIQVGYIADDLQPEAFAMTENGQRSIVDIYGDAVVGNLCAGFWSHDRRLKKIEEIINGARV